MTLTLLYVQAINLVSWKIQLASSPRSDRAVPKERGLVTSFYQTKLLIRQKEVNRKSRQIHFYVIRPSLSCLSSCKHERDGKDRAQGHSPSNSSLRGSSIETHCAVLDDVSEDLNPL